MSSTRINGQSTYRSPSPAHNPWREEMLGQLLGQMREHKLTQAPASAPKMPHQVQGKGRYVDLYV